MEQTIFSDYECVGETAYSEFDRVEQAIRSETENVKYIYSEFECVEETLVIL